MHRNGMVQHVIPRSLKYHPTMNERFDHYIRNVIAPYHQIFGIGKRFIETCIFQTFNILNRGKLDRLVPTLISFDGARTEKNQFICKPRPLMSLCMTITYSILSELLVTGKVLAIADKPLVTYLLYMNLDSVVLSLWAPRKDADGGVAYECIFDRS